MIWVVNRVVTTIEADEAIASSDFLKKKKMRFKNKEREERRRPKSQLVLIIEHDSFNHRT